MGLKKETLQRLIDEYTGKPENLGAYIAQCVDAHRSWCGDASNISILRKAAETRFQQELHSLDKDLRVLQRLCKHYETTRAVDPAGGSSGYTSCDCCGKEL